MTYEEALAELEARMYSAADCQDWLVFWELKEEMTAMMALRSDGYVIDYR